MRKFLDEKLVVAILVMCCVVMLFGAFLQAYAQDQALIASKTATETADRSADPLAPVDEAINDVAAKVSAAHQPTFGLDRIPALQGDVFGYPIWQYVASLIWIFLAFFVAALIDFIITRQLKRLAERTKTDIDDRLLDILHMPVKLTVFLVMLNAGVHMFDWPDWGQKILSTLFTIGMAVTIVVLVVRLVDLFLGLLERKFFPDDSQMAQLMMPVIGKSLKVFVIAIGALTAAQHLGFPIASVIAGLGIGGIAVALAAQDTLANLFGTVALLVDRPFRVGDRVEVEGYNGPIERIGLRSTRIRTLDGHLVTIPNKTVANAAINNIAMRPTIKQIMTFGLTYDTTPDKMREALTILRDVFTKHRDTHDVWINWKGYGAFSLDIQVIYWCKNLVYAEFLQALEDMNLEIKERFDAAGLDFAFPTQTVHLDQGAAATNTAQ